MYNIDGMHYEDITTDLMVACMREFFFLPSLLPTVMRDEQGCNILYFCYSLKYVGTIKYSVLSSKNITRTCIHIDGPTRDVTILLQT